MDERRMVVGSRDSFVKELKETNEGVERMESRSPIARHAEADQPTGVVCPVWQAYNGYHAVRTGSDSAQPSHAHDCPKNLPPHGLYRKPFMIYKFRALLDLWDEASNLFPDAKRLTACWVSFCGIAV